MALIWRSRAALAAAAVLVACAAGLMSERAIAGVATHVLTYTNFKGYYNQSTVAAQDGAHWLAYAMTNVRDAHEIAAAGIKVVVYTNPNRISRKEFGYTDDESTYAHDCSGKRITVTNRKDSTYLTDPTSASTQDRWRRQVQNMISRGAPVSVVFDDTADSLGRLRGKPCNFNQDDWTRRSVKLIESLPYPVLYNGLADIGGERDGGPHISPAIGLNKASNTLGGMFEGCYIRAYLPRGETPYALDSNWTVTENTQIQMATDGKLFVCHTGAVGDIRAEQAIDYREFTYASFMLTYDAKTSVLSEPFFKSPSGFDVNPEVQLVPTEPLSSAPSSIDALRTSTGAYGREYAACYVAGALVGPCAAVVNPDSSGQHAFPYTNYHHTLTFRGDGVLDNGTVSASGPAPPASLSSATGVIAFR